ncbi:MAG: tetratricopeptide repeat protein, partial [Proteobacteria bacterium]|nr:tetratricopeptide repeat protein [Pseudomonadota bacterium]
MDVELNNYTVSSGWARRVVSSRHAGLTRLLFLFALISPGAWADLPSFYGEKFVLKGKTWAEVRPPVSIVTASSGALKSEKAYRRQLDSVESTGGPYAYELAEPLLGLGRYHASNGRYGKARDLFRRALHNVRLNDGLYSELQTPYVRALLDTIRLSGDLNALDDRYNYFFRLYGSGQPPYTRLRMRASLEYLRWQREALRLEFDSQEKKRLLTLYQLNESLLTDTWESNSSSPEDQWKLTMSQIRNLYIL